MCFCMVLQDYIDCFYPKLKSFQTLRFPQSHPFTLRLRGSGENEGESEFRKFATYCVTHSPGSQGLIQHQIPAHGGAEPPCRSLSNCGGLLREGVQANAA